jgi:RimJ/RimL family protein N-acetyltransferase
VKPLELIQKARSTVTQLGVRGTGVHVARRMLTTVPGAETFRLFLIVLTTPRPTPAAEQASKNHTFRFASRDELVRFSKQPEAKLYERDIASFDTGNRCLLQLDGERLVGYSWVGTARLVELMWGLHFNMPDDMVYNYNGYTVPDYRGTSYQALRHLKILELSREHGTRRLFGYVDHLNYASLRGVEKSGYERVGVVRGVKREGRISFSLSVQDDAWSQLVRVGPIQH